MASLNRNGTFMLLVAQKETFWDVLMVNFIRMASAILFGTIPISMKGKYTFEPHVVLCELYSMSTEEFV